jgi:hypothetical protein
MFVDGDGNEQSFDVPGWIGITTDLAAHIEDIAAHLTEAGAGGSCLTTLEQIYVERPYRDLLTAPNEITVVVMSKADQSGMNMLQEFAGRIDDHELLTALVGRRLGPAIAGWTFTEVRVLKRGGNRGTSTGQESPLHAGTETPLDYSRQGTLHVIYTAHAGADDFQRIAADLDRVAKDCPHLVLVVEGLLPAADLRKHLDLSLQNLPPDVLFDLKTVRRNKEELARAYTVATTETNRAYREWNELPVAGRQTSFSEQPFASRLLAWAVGRGVEVVPEETSLEAWLANAAWDSVAHHADAAAARGDAAAMWAATRKEWEMLARANLLRDADVNAQITRILQVERRGHDALYVVGVLHSLNEDLLIRGLKAVVYERRFIEPASERFLQALVTNSFDDQPAAVREQIETHPFLLERLGMFARPTTSYADVLNVIHEIGKAAAARNITLRQIVDHVITVPRFQEAARTFEETSLRRFLAWTFIMDAIDGAFISRSDVERYLDLSKK